MLLFQIDTSDDRPIYAQIADQVKLAVATGVLRPGDLVPSVRELSKQLVVNPHTVARAYRDLQGERLISAVRGTGLQVTDEAPSRCMVERRSAVRRRMRSLIEEARRGEMTREEMQELLREEWDGGNGAVAPGSH